MEGVVKALINLNDGTIQLEGPQDFVEKYLDKYHPVIEKGAKPASIPEKKVEEDKEERKTQKRTRTAKSTAGPTCTEKVQDLVNVSYFKEPKTREDVQAELLNRGTRYPSKDVSAVLNNFFRGNKLLKTGVGKNAKYYTNV